MNYNNGEYGQKIYANFGESITGGTSLQLSLMPAYGSEKLITSGVTIGASNITVDDEDWIANQYLEYTIANGDLDKAGQWRVQGQALVSGVLKKSDYKQFTVLP
jgi:hypothetical protein